MKQQIQQLLREKFPELDLRVELDEHGRNIVSVYGQCESWPQLVEVGQAVAKVPGVHNVVSEMTVRGLDIPKKDYTPFIEKGRQAGQLDRCDVVIVGLGIVGCAIARILCKYNLSVIAVDMGEDVATGATKANNGGVHHAGSVKPGTLKAKLSVRGNRMYDEWAKELNFDFVRWGSMTVIEDMNYLDGIYDTFKTSMTNGDWRPSMINGEQVLQVEPRFAEHGIKPVAAVWLPSQGKVHPYDAAVAMAENAAVNGVRFLLNCTVGDVLVEDGRACGVVTERGVIRAKYVINSAGVYSDEIAEMAGDKFFTIHPRRGTLVIIDKHKPPMYQAGSSVFEPELKSRRNVESKGGGMDVTPSRNILIGPSASEQPDKEDTETSREDLDYVMWRNQNPQVGEGDIIRLFAGTRPADFKEDYVVEESPIARGFITAGAVQSPGIGASPAVAEMVEGLLLSAMEREGDTAPEVRDDYIARREKPVRFHELSREQQDELIRQRPEYGHVICRCETITEGEILDAIRSPLLPGSIDAIKRRTRAGMGRCQGGFCQPRVLEILARELGQQWVDVNLNRPGTNILKAENR